MKPCDATSFIFSTLLAISGATQASTTIYSDNFSSDTPALNSVPSGWTIGNGGTVDILAPVNIWGIQCESASSKCIDLDGSTDKSGMLISPNLDLLKGSSYVVTFELAGNQRLDQTDTVIITFDGVTDTLNLTENTPWETYSISVTQTHDEETNLTFIDSSNNNVGAILGDVVIVDPPALAVIPEPATIALLGLGLLGFAVVRCKSGNNAVKRLRNLRTLV